jgi:hypothetical protein
MIGKAIIAALPKNDSPTGLPPAQFAAPGYINFILPSTTMPPQPPPTTATATATKEGEVFAQMFKTKKDRTVTNTLSVGEPTMKRSRKEAKAAKGAITSLLSSTSPLPSLLSSSSPSPSVPTKSERKKRTFEIKQVPATFDPEAYAVYVKYQRIIHKEEDKEHTEKGYTRFLCTNPFPVIYLCLFISAKTT